MALWEVASWRRERGFCDVVHEDPGTLKKRFQGSFGRTLLTERNPQRWELLSQPSKKNSTERLWSGPSKEAPLNLSDRRQKMCCFHTDKET